MSDGEVKQHIASQVAFLLNGRSEFDESLRATGKRVADVEFELRTALATAKLRQAVISGEQTPTRAQAAAFYRSHLARYTHREQRDFYIVEGLTSESAARRVKADLARNGRIAHMSFHESLERPSNLKSAKAIGRAIFSAAPNTLGGPVRLSKYFALFEVTRVRPRSVEPFAQVHGAIEQRLASEDRQRAVAEFVRELRRKWVARTSCWPGFVTQRCRQYNGAISADEAPFTLE